MDAPAFQGGLVERISQSRRSSARKRIDGRPIWSSHAHRSRDREFVTSAALPMPHSDLKLIVDFGDGGETDGSYITSPRAEPRIAPGCQHADPGGVHIPR
jgi:hypothetical protein